jgi:prolyl-tRNA synthetase
MQEKSYLNGHEFNTFVETLLKEELTEKAAPKAFAPFADKYGIGYVEVSLCVKLYASAKEGDRCPKCGAPLKSARGIEVSQVFQLGTKYSEAMGATFMDEDGKEKPFQMGCYGIGVSRTLAAVVEQHHDEHGIVWPVCVAPYEVEIIPLDAKGEVWDAAEQIANELTEAGIEVVVDDRKERPGVKFNDADLMGYPYQVVCGKRGIKNGVVEVKERATGERADVAIAEVASYLANRVIAERK